MGPVPGPNAVFEDFGDTWLFATSWAQPTQLTARSRHAATNDVVHARALLLGGYNGGGSPIGTGFEITQTGTRQISGPSPSARYYFGLAWDTLRDTALLFGGYAGGALGDTWTWDSTWSQRTPAPTPTARYQTTLGWDGTNIVMFGGQVASFTYTDETWLWNGTTWTQSTGGVTPPVRASAAAGYDPVRKELVMFGGASPIAGGLDDTWLWNGQAWRDAAPPFHPNRRNNATLTWNPARQRLVLVGTPGLNLDSYEWSGTEWRALDALDAPSGRAGHAAYTSLDGGGIAIHGGQDNETFATMNETWELRWQATSSSERCDGSDLDGDGLNRCADPDCWPVCAPLCPPGTTCDATAPRCGDDVCGAGRESCSTCPEDCGSCAAVCGNYVCDMGETGCPGDCPM